MLSYQGRSIQEESEGWSPRNERTVVDNFACLIPPNFDQDMVHYLLLRFQLEEVQYYLQNLTKEVKYAKYYDDDSSDVSDTKRLSPDVRIRYKLVQERSKIIESIIQLYPPFIFRNENFALNLESCQEVKEVYLNSNDQISTIIGDHGENIKNIEQQFSVKITISDIPLSIKNSPNSIYKDSLCKLLIRGNSKDNISNCFQHIQNIMKCKDPKNMLQSQNNKISSNNSDFLPPAPWEINNNNTSTQNEEEEKDEKDIYGFNSLLKNKEGDYMSLFNKQDPPGS